MSGKIILLLLAVLLAASGVGPFLPAGARAVAETGTAAEAATSRARSKDPLNVRFVFDKPYYTANDSFTAKIVLHNSDDVTLKKARVVLTVKRKSGSRLATVVRKTWWKSLSPGTTTLDLEKDIANLGLRDGSYPASVTVDRSRTADELVKESSLVVMNDHPMPPVSVVLLWNLDDATHFAPSGSLVDRTLLKDIEEDPAEPGFYLEPLLILEKYPGITVNVNFTPLMLEEIMAVRSGTLEKNRKETSGALSKEQSAARKLLQSYVNFLQLERVELIPAPYAYPSLKFLAARKWDADALAQIKMGRELVMKAFNGQVVPTSLYLPGFELDRRALTFLTKTKTSHTVIDEEGFPKKGDEDIYQPYEVTGEDGKKVTVFYRDNSLSRVLVSERDEELASQNLIGSLARIYLGSPSEGRVVVIAPESRIDPGLSEAIYGKFEKVPWIQTISLRQGKRNFPARETTLPKSKADNKAETYRHSLARTRTQFMHFQDAAQGPVPLKDTLFKKLLIAQSNHFFKEGPASKNNGLSFLRDIDGEIDAEWQKLAFVENQSVTLPTAKGKIPVVIQNSGPYTMRLSLTLKGEGLVFPEGNAHTVELKPKENLFSFPVTMKSGGSSVSATLHSGNYVIKEVDFTVNKASSAGQRTLVIGVVAVLVIALFSVWGYRHRRKAGQASPS